MTDKKMTTKDERTCMQQRVHKRQYTDPTRRTLEESVNKLKESFSIVLKPTNWELERKLIYQLGRIEGSVVCSRYVLCLSKE
jgi:hypothetical protein